MLWFSSKKSKAQICYAIQEALKLLDELADMGADQTASGWDMSEYATHISDDVISDELGNRAADQTATGMSVSEHSCLLEKQLRIVAERNNCKLAPRPYS